MFVYEELKMGNMLEKSGWKEKVGKWFNEQIASPAPEDGGHYEPSSKEEPLIEQDWKNKRDYALGGTPINADQVLTDDVRQAIDRKELKVEDGKIVPNK